MSLPAANPTDLPHLSRRLVEQANNSLQAHNGGGERRSCRGVISDAKGLAAIAGFSRGDPDEGFALERVCRYVSRLCSGTASGLFMRPAAARSSASAAPPCGLLIAKLPATQQQEAFSAAFRGLWTSEGNSQVLIPVRELAAWMESNILLQLASAPFDKQDETLVPEAGSCVNCPKRTGFNKLLFPDVRKDSCTSPDCFRAKIDACVKKTLDTKPQLIQISAAWNSREGAPLGRNRYVELEIKKPKANGASTKLSANQKPCEKMAEAIVMDGGKRGQVVKVCADPTCRVHHPNTPSPQQVERGRAEERKRIEKEKLAITTRHRVLATILQRVSAPLKKADLLAVAHYLIGHLSYSQVPALAKRHKIEAKKDSASAQELLDKQMSAYDEAELCKLLVEISLLDSAYQRSTPSRDDVLMEVAKRYRVDTEKLQKAVAKELAAKRDKKTKAKAKPKDRKTAS